MANENENGVFLDPNTGNIIASGQVQANGVVVPSTSDVVFNDVTLQDKLDEHALVTHEHSQIDIIDPTFQKIVSEDDTTLPTVIQLDANNPIVIFDEINSSSWNISAECENMNKIGSFTWELMILAQHDITSISYDNDITYVGSDKNTLVDKLKLIDDQPTYHVFAFRILHRESNDYKTINYCYSFKK